MKPNKTFIIRHKQTKELWIASSGKSSWRATGHAKNAWMNSNSKVKRDPLMLPFLKPSTSSYEKYKDLRFDDQDVYEVVELKPESHDKLKEAINYLKTITSLPILSDGFRKEIKNFIKEVESDLQ
jgi:hypothetical protein